MPENSTPTGLVGSSLAGSAVTMPPINMPKRFNVEQAANGFIITLQNKRDYNERRHIATDTEAVMEIIRSYLSEE
jgi:hypothetical protein